VLPFPDNKFDVVASALVINFIPDRPRALSEMQRVARSDGLVAGYVWDFAGGRSPASPIARTLRALGHNTTLVPGAADTRMDALVELFHGAGLADVEAREIEVSLEFPDFDDLWTSLTPGYSPTTKLLRGLSAAEQARVQDHVRSRLVNEPDGRVSFSSVANAVRARAP
jgi:SAM-dependent methyltransferase